MRAKFSGTYLDPTPTRATFMDGSGLSHAEAVELSDAVWSRAVIYSPVAGDIVLVDNKRTGHGRMNVDGGETRRVVSYIAGHFALPSAVGVRVEVSDESAV